MPRHAARIADYTRRDPRHVEAFMRDAYPLLDRLSADQFAHAVRAAAAVIDEAGTEKAERLARWLGL